MAYLEIIGAERRRRLLLSYAPVNIGRCATNMIVLDDPLASRAHCVVEMTPRGHQVHDLASRNGTYRNGQKIEAAVLEYGDEVQVGITRFRFHADTSEDG